MKAILIVTLHNDFFLEDGIVAVHDRAYSKNKIVT